MHDVCANRNRCTHNTSRVPPARRYKHRLARLNDHAILRGLWKIWKTLQVYVIEVIDLRRAWRALMRIDVGRILGCEKDEFLVAVDLRNHCVRIVGIEMHQWELASDPSD